MSSGTRARVTPGALINIELFSPQLLVTWIDDGGDFAAFSVDAPVLDVPGWHHVGVTWQQPAREILFYVDGQLFQIFTSVATITAFAGNKLAPIGACDCDIDEVEISSRARTPDEMDRRYRALLLQ